MKSRTPKPAATPQKIFSGKRLHVPADSFPVVAIGASAGGLEAYKEFFHALPVDTGMAFVLIQHLDPSHHSLLAEILSKATRIPVNEVKSGVRIEPNCVYVIPPGAFMAISAGAFTLTPRSKESGQHLSVNFFIMPQTVFRPYGKDGSDSVRCTNEKCLTLNHPKPNIAGIVGVNFLQKKSDLQHTRHPFLLWPRGGTLFLCNLKRRNDHGF